MVLQIKKASRSDTKLRMALVAPSGAGKTYTSLRFAFSNLVENPKVLIIDTEHGSSQKYQGLKPDSIPWEFDIIEITEEQKYSPSVYVEAIQLGEQNGYDIIIIDSLSHAWEAEGGALDMQAKAGGRFTDWAKITPLHNSLVRKILNSSTHIIATMRTKTEWATDESSGKIKPVKVGLEAVQRKGIEYEFDIVIRLDQNHIVEVDKTRFAEMDGKSTSNPSASFIQPIINFLNSGKELPKEPVIVAESISIKTPQELFQHYADKIDEDTIRSILTDNNIRGFTIGDVPKYMKLIEDSL